MKLREFTDLSQLPQFLHKQFGPHCVLLRTQGHFVFRLPSLQATYSGSFFTLSTPHLQDTWLSVPSSSWHSLLFLHSLHRQSLEQGTPEPTQGQRVCPSLLLTHESWPSLLFFPQEHANFLFASSVDFETSIEYENINHSPF